MAGDLLLRAADLPGLDLLGLMIYDEDGEAAGLCVVSGLPESPVAMAIHGRHLPRHRQRVSLGDASTRDRVARRVAAIVGLECGATAPWFHALPGEALWWLETPGDDDPSPRWDASDVPSLAALDPADDTRLPDGCRVVDAAALVLVARHVGQGVR